jgi:hypothetical protein
MRKPRRKIDEEDLKLLKVKNQTNDLKHTLAAVDETRNVYCWRTLKFKNIYVEISSNKCHISFLIFLFLFCMQRRCNSEQFHQTAKQQN